MQFIQKDKFHIQKSLKSHSEIVVVDFLHELIDKNVFGTVRTNHIVKDHCLSNAFAMQ